MSIPQTVTQVKPNVTNRNDILELCDHCLQQYRDAWAVFVATGSHEAFLQAMAAEQDREMLLSEL